MTHMCVICVCIYIYIYIYLYISIYLSLSIYIYIYIHVEDYVSLPVHALVARCNGIVQHEPLCARTWCSMHTPVACCPRRPSADSAAI